MYEKVERRKPGNKPGIIGYISMKEWLTVSYGDEGFGWDTDASRYEEVQVVVSPLMSDDVLAEGSRLVVSADLVDVVVYPDGDRYYQFKYR